MLVKSGVPPGIEESLAENEPAQKKRRTADVAPHKPAGISFGGSRTAQTQSAAIFEWSDNDDAPVAPPSSTKTSLREMHVEVRSKGGADA